MMANSVRNYIRAAKIECLERGKICNSAKATAVIARTADLVERLRPRHRKDDTKDWSILVSFLGSLLTKTGRANETLKLCGPLIVPGGILVHDPILHDVYAKALAVFNLDDGISYIEDRLGNEGILANNPSSHNTLVAFYLHKKEFGLVIDHLLPRLKGAGILATSPISHVSLAIAYVENQQKEKAASHLRSHMQAGGVLHNNHKAFQLYRRALQPS